MEVVNDNLEILFPNEIRLKGYKIRDYEKGDVDLNETSSYKILLSKDIDKNTNRIIIKNISKYNIKQYHAYIYTMFQEDDENPNRRLKSLGFCIKQDFVLMQKSRESDSNFIKDCKK